jgi:2-oxoglutarate dehydrogenase E2 component (dihydrolipoamide succinyltransferase)
LKKIFVPELFEENKAATIVFWHKEEGDIIEKDEELVELETDEEKFTITSTTSGIITNILKEEGDKVKVGDVIAYIEEE